MQRRRQWILKSDTPTTNTTKIHHTIVTSGVKNLARRQDSGSLSAGGHSASPFSVSPNK